MEMLAALDRVPVQEIVEQDLRALLSAKLQLDVSEISNGITLGDLGFDSLALSDLAEAIEEKFDVQVPNRTLPATLTVGQLEALLLSKKGVGACSVVAEPAD